MQKHFCRLLVHLLTPIRPPDFIYGFLFHNRETRAVPLLCNQTSLFQRGLNLPKTMHLEYGVQKEALE